MRHLPLPLLALLSSAAGCGKPVDTHWLTDPGVAGHAAYLPLSGTAHDPSAAAATISCESCHPSTTFKVFDCTSCHSSAVCDPYHAGVSDYPAAGTVTSADCYRCHPQGSSLMSPAQHAPYFAIGTASHPALCAQCHTDPTNRSDPGKLVCLSCHADDQANPIAAHGRQPGPAGSPGSAGPGDGHHDTHCFQCHTMVPPLALFGGPGPGVAGRPWAEDWTVATCSKCH